MKIIDSLIHLIQYDRKNLPLLRASFSSVKKVVDKNKDEKANPFKKISINPLSLGSKFLSGLKDEEKP